MKINPESLVKRLARWFLSNVRSPEYHPNDYFLKQFKSFIDNLRLHDKCDNVLWINAENFLLKLADKDEAYRQRLIAIVFGLQSVKFKISEWDMAMIKVYYGLPVSIGDFKT